MKKYRIPLVRDTISQLDLSALSKWLTKNPQLTKGPLSEKFEQKFAQWQGCNYAHYVNSGSSANLLAINSLLIAGKLKPGDKIIAPAVSWTTTVAPITQLNCEPLLCDCDLNTLGLDLKHFEQLANKSGVKAVIICHVLGIPNQLYEITAICRKYGLALIEDCCEALGSEYRGKKVGNFDGISTFSFYYGHHMSTIEGGMVCTNSKQLSNTIRSLRSHGWNRDLDTDLALSLRKKYSVDPFADKYTFYHPGYNFRGTDLGAFLGLRQLRKLPGFIKSRNKIWHYYLSFTQTSAWKPSPDKNSFISGFAFPLISANRGKLAEKLEEHGIESRPLVSGSIGRQPWFIEKYGHTKLKNADLIHDHGLYIPINPDLSFSEVKEISNIISQPGSGSITKPVFTR